jgi:hypothetical protein
MPNGFEHPLRGEEFPQAVKQVLEGIEEQHAKLDYFRTMLLRTESMRGTARLFAYVWSEDYKKQPPAVHDQIWMRLRDRYVEWRIARDDDFWTALHQAADQPG